MSRAARIRPTASPADPSRRAGSGLVTVLARALALLVGASLLVVPPAGAATWPPPSYVEALSEIGLRGGRLAWNGVAVGMTLAQVEHAIGPLAAPDPRPGLLCDLHYIAATVDGQRLGLEFSGTGRDAALRSITVLLEPRIGEVFETSVVVAALHSRLDLAFVPSPHAPRSPESEVEKPLYRTRYDELVFVDPEAGVVIGEVCVD